MNFDEHDLVSVAKKRDLKARLKPLQKLQGGKSYGKGKGKGKTI